MNKGLTILGFMMMALTASSQTLFDRYQSTSSSAMDFQASQKVDDFLSRLDHKRKSDDKTNLHFLFKSAHKNFLKHYSQYADFNEIFQAGNYDCLTATALFSVMLNKLDYDFSIVETNYHIFIMVHTADGDVLLESTDPLNGFESDRKQIEKRIGVYKQNVIASASSKSFHLYDFNIYNEVRPEQLTGLMYFNKAVKAFNSKQWILSVDHLEKAKNIYNSPRVAELAELLLGAIPFDEIDAPVRKAMELKLNSFKRDIRTTLAAR